MSGTVWDSAMLPVLAPISEDSLYTCGSVSSVNEVEGKLALQRLTKEV